MARNSLQKRHFALEYAQSRNGKDAAVRAGYSESGARQRAYELLKDPQVRRWVAAIASKAADRAELTVAEVVMELRRILEVDPADAQNDDGSIRGLREWPVDLRRALGGYEVRESYEQPVHDSARLVGLAEDAIESGKYEGLDVETALLSFAREAESDLKKPKLLKVVIRRLKFWSKTEASKQLLMKMGAFDEHNRQLGGSLADLINKAREGSQ